MKKKIATTAALSGLTLILFGCVGTPSRPDSADSHPANPKAAQSPMITARWSLLDTNLAPPAPATNAAAGHEHHEGHDTKAKSTLP